MYKIVICDDEPLILFKIKAIFDWEKFGFELVGEATNGEDLLKLIDEKKPDVVFTDINMSSLSGIELISLLREKKDQTTFVIISGYDDFKYAQKAINLQVFSYLLKPVSAEDANNLLENLGVYLDEKYGVSESLNVDNAKNISFNKMIEYINQNYLEKLSLADLSQQFDINKTYCCYLFKNNFNTSFSKYILTLRMEKAAELITKTDMTITEISDFLGYDYYHFNKIFKNHFSVTPKQYKALHI